MYRFNSEIATKQVLDILQSVATAYPAYPSERAIFPLIIVEEPTQKHNQIQSKVSLQFTVSVWSDDMFLASSLLEKAVIELETLNIRLVNTTPSFKDLVTGKWRKNGVFEVRYNTLTNTYEITR